jgi:hypothetical protein
MSLIAQVPKTEIPAGVLAFAMEQGVSDYLSPVLEMTRAIFPESPLTLSVEADPEISNDWHIVLGVRAPGTQVDEGLASLDEWHDGLFSCCPAPLVSVFRLGLSLAA